MTTNRLWDMEYNYSVAVHVEWEKPKLSKNGVVRIPKWTIAKTIYFYLYLPTANWNAWVGCILFLQACIVQNTPTGDWFTYNTVLAFTWQQKIISQYTYMHKIRVQHTPHKWNNNTPNKAPYNKTILHFVCFTWGGNDAPTKSPTTSPTANPTTSASSLFAI